MSFLRCCWVLFLFFLLAKSPIFAQTSLTILNQANEVLIGVEVYQNDSLITISDVNGNVILEQLAKSDIVRFKYLSYKEQYFNGTELLQLQSIVLDADDILLDEVTLIGRNQLTRSEIPFQINRISETEIKSTHAQTSADLLEKNASVYIQRSQMGGGSPILRGFEANKILLVVDGVRLNNAIYRSGHLQNAITIDHGALSSAEVIFGPSSINYGSDALGGVVHFKTKAPRLNTSSDIPLKFNGALFTRFASANGEKRIHGDFNIGRRKWAWYGSLSFTDFDDLKSGQSYDDQFPEFGKRNLYVDVSGDEDRIVTNPNPHEQIGTAYYQYDIIQKFKYQINEEAFIFGNFQFSNSSDIPRYDQLIDQNNGVFRFSEWYYGPQKRLMFSSGFQSSRPSPLYDQIIVIGAYQNIEEERNSRSFNQDDLNKLLEQLDVASISLDLKKRLNKRYKFNYGLDWQYNYVNSLGQNINREGFSELALSRYPSGGSRTGTGGIYIHNNIALSNRIDWHSGGRLNYQFAKFDYLRSDPFDWPEFYFDGFSNENFSATLMHALNYKVNKQIRVNWNIATAFRNPNIDDLAKVRIKSNEISIPNPNLKPEENVSTELSLNYNSAFINFEAVAFYSRLKNAIVRLPGTLPNGSSFYELNGDSLIVTQNFNASKGSIYGYSIAGDVRLNAHWKLSFQLNKTVGRATDELDFEFPLAHIPPFFGNFNVSYSTSFCDLNLAYRFNGFKDINDFGGSTDNPELATPIGSLAWHTWNIYSNFKLTNQLECALAMENILDRHYRLFASGVSAPGRNIVFSLSYKFN